MNGTKQRTIVWVVGGIVGVGLLPVLLYWMLVLRSPAVSAGEAQAMLARSNSTAVLVDVRPAEAYASHHIAGATNWPATEIAALTNPSSLPAELKGKQLLLIDDGRWHSSAAACRLKRAINAEGFSVQGGMAAWNATLNASSGDARPVSSLKQWVAVITGFGIKPAHMILCLGLVFWLRRQQASDLAALRWGLLIFLLGETACALNYILAGGWSDAWEYLHDFGMTVGMSFATYAMLDGMDRRLLKYSAQKERCAAINLCRACAKYADVPCGLRRLFHLLIPASMILAAMPLFSPLQVISYDATVFGSVANFSHLFASDWFELRYCPIVAIVLLTGSWLVLLLKRDDPVTPSKMLFAAAMGPLGFGLMRLLLYTAYRDELIWSNLWEEITEFLFVAGAGYVLWVFRDSLFKPAQAGGELTSAERAEA